MCWICIVIQRILIVDMKCSVVDLWLLIAMSEVVRMYEGFHKIDRIIDTT